MRNDFVELIPDRAVPGILLMVCVFVFAQTCWQVRNGKVRLHGTVWRAEQPGYFAVLVVFKLLVSALGIAFGIHAL